MPYGLKPLACDPTRAISIESEVKDGHPIAEVTLLQESTFKKANSKVD